MRLSTHHRLVLLAILVFVHAFSLGLYSRSGLEPSPGIEFLYDVAFVCSVVWWLRAEAERYGVNQVYCLGFLVGVGWMIMIPYHLFKTRGVRGLIPLIALVSSFVAAHILGVLVYMIFQEG
jgi:hypothetical protein